MKGNLMTDKPAPVVPPNATLRPQRWQSRPKPSLPKRVLSLSKDRFDLHRPGELSDTYVLGRGIASRDAYHVCG